MNFEEYAQGIAGKASNIVKKILIIVVVVVIAIFIGIIIFK